MFTYAEIIVEKREHANNISILNKLKKSNETKCSITKLYV